MRAFCVDPYNCEDLKLYPSSASAKTHASNTTERTTWKALDIVTTITESDYIIITSLTTVTTWNALGIRTTITESDYTITTPTTTLSNAFVSTQTDSITEITNRNSVQANSTSQYRHTNPTSSMMSIGTAGNITSTVPSGSSDITPQTSQSSRNAGGHRTNVSVIGLAVGLTCVALLLLGFILRPRFSRMRRHTSKPDPFNHFAVGIPVEPISRRL